MCNNTPNDDNVNINDYDIQIVADYSSGLRFSGCSGCSGSVMGMIC